MNALRIVCLLLVAIALAVAVGVARARRVRRREAREDRAEYAARAARRDFEASIRTHLTESADEWAARTGNTVPVRTITRLPEGDA